MLQRSSGPFASERATRSRWIFFFLPFVLGEHLLAIDTPGQLLVELPSLRMKQEICARVSGKSGLANTESRAYGEFWS
jgi:hypothetical protein